MTSTHRCTCGRVLTHVAPDSRSRAVTMPGSCPRCDVERSRVPDAYLIVDVLERWRRGKGLPNLIVEAPEQYE